MIEYDLVREMISTRLRNVRRDHFDLPETDWEDGYNAALGFEIKFLENLYQLMRDKNEGTTEDNDVGC